MCETQLAQGNRTLWERILELLVENLVERRDRRLVVELRGEDSPYEKEIGDHSASELRSLDPELRARVAELLLDRYLAQQGRVDLLKGRRAYRRDIRDLTPEDLPAVLQRLT
jgi:hypothetical protein